MWFDIRIWSIAQQVISQKLLVHILLFQFRKNDVEFGVGTILSFQWHFVPNFVLIHIILIGLGFSTFLLLYWHSLCWQASKGRTGGPLTPMQYLVSYLTYIRLTRTIERNDLMVEAAKSALADKSSEVTNNALYLFSYLICCYWDRFKFY